MMLLIGCWIWVLWMVVLVNVVICDCWELLMFEMDIIGLVFGNCYDEVILYVLYEVMEWYSVVVVVVGEIMFEVLIDDVVGFDSVYLVEMICDVGDDVDFVCIDVWDGYYCFVVEFIFVMLEVIFGGFGLYYDFNVVLLWVIIEVVQLCIMVISGVCEDFLLVIYYWFGWVYIYVKV